MKPSTGMKRFLTRAVAAGLAASIVVVADTSVGPGWYGDLLGWLQPTPRSVAPPTPIVRSGPVGPPVSVTPMRPEGNDSSVSAVPQSLILVRTQRGRNSREGFAQIGVRQQSPQTYTAGALLANGARLTEIYDDYVVLERDGRKARLHLQGLPEPEVRSARGLLTVGGIPEPTELIASSHDALTDYVRPSPVFVGDQLRGLALYPGRDSVPFSQLGLQPGDVVTRINGSLISDASEALVAFQVLMDGTVLNVDLERDGIPQALALDGSILKRAAALPPEVTRIAKTTPRESSSSVVPSSLLTQGKWP